MSGCGQLHVIVLSDIEIVWQHPEKCTGTSTEIPSQKGQQKEQNQKIQTDMRKNAKGKGEHHLHGLFWTIKKQLHSKQRYNYGGQNHSGNIRWIL